MAAESEEYLAVLKASYDYDPQAEGEIPIKESQLLFLIEKTDDELVTFTLYHLSNTDQNSHKLVESQSKGGITGGREPSWSCTRCLCRAGPCSPASLSRVPHFPRQADHTFVVKAIYDYDASAPGELTIKEDETLLVFNAEEEWLLVQSQKEGGKAGFVPGNYVEVCLPPIGVVLSSSLTYYRRQGKRNPLLRQCLRLSKLLSHLR